LREKVQSLTGVLEMLITFGLVMGGLFKGFFTPTEAGAIGACFIDALALILLTIPIFFPVAVNIGYDPIWFGVIIVMVTQVGVITPPVGVNVYVVSGVAKDVPLEVIFKGIVSLLLALIAAVILMVIFPQIALFLPSFMR
jgi:C4-dicarboxylate transporter DctM subunit